jgi:hypothetical protein
MEKRQTLQQTMEEKLAIHMQKSETRPISLTMYKNQLQIYKIY